MLKILNACISNSKKDEITNIEFDLGVHQIKYDDRKIFNFLNLKNQYLTSGTFSIDDLKIIDENEKTSRLMAFKINSKVFSVLCVFELTDEFKKEGFTKFKKDLVDLKNLPLETIEEKSDKIKRIINCIKLAKPLYLTIDLNDETNIEQKDFILEEIKTAEVKYIFILEALINKETLKEDIIEAEIENNIHNFATGTFSTLPIIEAVQTEQQSYEKEFEGFYSIDTTSSESKKKNAELVRPTNDGAKKSINFKMLLSFTKLLILNINLYYLFVFVFSFFVGLGALSSTYLIRTNHISIGVVLIVLFVLFTFVNTYIYSSTYAGVRKHLDRLYKIVLYIILFLIATIAGLAASFGGLYLLNSINASIVISDFVFNDYLVALIVFPILIILCILSSPLAKLYVIWHKFKIKHFPKKDNA